MVDARLIKLFVVALHRLCLVVVIVLAGCFVRWLWVRFVSCLVADMVMGLGVGVVACSFVFVWASYLSLFDFS